MYVIVNRDERWGWGEGVDSRTRMFLTSGESCPSLSPGCCKIQKIVS